MPDKLIIVIPSYQRAETLKAKTLAYLQTTNYDPSTVYVFVADEDQKRQYEATLEPGTYREIVVGVPGMRAIRNFIQSYFPEGTRMFCMDDDIIELRQKVHDKLHIPLEDIQGLIDTGFGFCDQAGARLWGIYPVLNPMFMKETVTFDLRYIVGCVWGVINTHDEKTYVTIDDKEDFERSILFYALDGSVVRINYIAPNTKYYKEPGGMQVTRTPERVTESAHYLAQKFPQFCSLNDKKKSGHLEVRLRDKRGK